MSVSNPPTCALGLSPADLSAWRDGALSPDAAQRIAAHAVNCPACQRINAADDALAAALRADLPPAPDPRNWRLLQARIAAAQPGWRMTAPRRAVWSGLVAAAAVLVISALFLSLFGQLAQRRGAVSLRKHVSSGPPKALAHVMPTQPIAGPKLNWQLGSAPSSIVPQSEKDAFPSNYAFDPTDAHVAYICTARATATATTSVNIWQTRDDAQTWALVSAIPFNGFIGDCSLNVDAHNPQHVALAVWGQDSHGQGSVNSSYISDDGGQTWRALSQGELLDDLASRGETSIATMWPLSNFSSIVNGSPTRLVVTQDDWRTWQPIDAPLLAQGYVISSAWQRPSDGAVLVSTIKRPSTTPEYMLWQSVDLGAHWTLLPMPPNLTANATFVVTQPQGNTPWQACGFSTMGSNATLDQLIGCTRDGGQTWTPRPLPALKAPCDNGVATCLAQQTVGGWGAALLPDGTLMAVFYAGSNDSGVVQTLSMHHIFLLRPGSSQWEDVGPAPNNGLDTISAPPTGTFVSVTGGMGLDGVSGSIVGHLGGDVPNRGVFAVATAP